MSIFLLCPGQGAQHPGMGKAWFDQHPAAQAIFTQADRILGFSLSELCFNGSDADLSRTDISQPAIYTTSVAAYAALMSTGRLEANHVSALAGLSLGEFTALHLAGCFSFEAGLRLVQLRGKAMQEAAEATDSSMVAITGDVTEETITTLCEKACEGDDAAILVPANYNSPLQVVVSGTTGACEKAVPIANEMGLKPTPLAVAGAFHSPLMAPAADALREALDDTHMMTPEKPVISNVTAAPHIKDVQTIKNLLVDQLTSPVKWSQSMQLAARDHADAAFHELAPGKVLSGLMRRIERGIKVTNHNEPA